MFRHFLYDFQRQTFTAGGGQCLVWRPLGLFLYFLLVMWLCSLHLTLTFSTDQSTGEHEAAEMRVSTTNFQTMVSYHKMVDCYGQVGSKSKRIRLTMLGFAVE